MTPPSSPHLLIIAALLLAGSVLPGCADSVTDTGGDAGPTRLKYELDARYHVFFCDPDYWPVVRDDEPQRAKEQFPVIAADEERFSAILRHLRLAPGTGFTAEQQLAIYRESKRLSSIVLEESDVGYAFQLRAERQERYVNVSGEISRSGRVSGERWQPGSNVCPICLSGDTRIAAARGEVPVSALRAGDLVWSLSQDGTRVLVPVRRTGRMPLRGAVPLLRLRLQGGAELIAAGAHPVPDGRQLGDLRPGDELGGVRVESLQLRYLRLAATYDLLPAGATGVYWANGALLASTLK
jgi:hypothetical protein